LILRLIADLILNLIADLAPNQTADPIPNLQLDQVRARDPTLDLTLDFIWSHQLQSFRSP
jgi:hypothetical protein